jgi:hypothetical protein
MGKSAQLREVDAPQGERMMRLEFASGQIT